MREREEGEGEREREREMSDIHESRSPEDDG